MISLLTDERHSLAQHAAGFSAMTDTIAAAKRLKDLAVCGQTATQ